MASCERFARVSEALQNVTEILDLKKKTQSYIDQLHNFGKRERERESDPKRWIATVILLFF